MNVGSFKTQKYLVAVKSLITEDQYNNLVQKFFRNFFSPENSIDLSSEDVIREVSLDAGLSQDEINKALERASTDELKQQLRANSDRATKLGAFGLPFTYLQLEKPYGIWGSDRIHLIGHLLGESKPPILQ